MKLPKVLLAIGVGITGGGAVAIAPASAAVSAPEAIHEYFVERDLAWYGNERSLSLASYRNSTKVSPQARAHLDERRSIADSTRAELGLAAETVDTHTDSSTSGSVCPGLPSFIRGGSRLYRTGTWTDLSWNAASLGDSSIGDEYELCVLRLQPNSRWMILLVKPLPIPPYSEPDIPDTTPTPAAMGLRPASTDRTAARQARQLRTASERPDRPGPPGTFSASSVLYTYNRPAAAQYGLVWSGGVYDGINAIKPAFNPAYDKQDNDCTNFVSQVLRAGGWNLRDGYDPDDPGNWTPNLWGPRGPSKSWSRAAWLFNFAINVTDRAYSLGEATPDNDWNNIWDLMPGDVVFIDWDPDYAIDHALVVVGRDTFLGFTEPTISQHSNHRHNLPMSTYIKLAAQDVGAMTFWPVVPRSSYSE